MQQSGGLNLFESHFVMGCIECSRIHTKTETDEIRALHDWLHWKDTDYGMVKYKSDRTQYVSYLHIIEIELFVQILSDLASIYKKEYPYSGKEDFIKHVFEFSIYDLKNIIETEFTWISSPPKERQFTYYYEYDRSSKEFLDYAIPAELTIEHFKQYFKKVIRIIDEFDFNNILNNDLNLKSEYKKMNQLSSTEVKEMFFECLFTDFYWETLNKYELEKVYLFALDYQSELFKPTLEYFRKRKVQIENGESPEFMPPSKDEIYSNVVDLINRLKPIVGTEAANKELHTPPPETKSDRLKTELSKYGFFELSKVKQLSEPNKQKLIELISANLLPYAIAMFDFLQFIEFLEKNYFKIKRELNREVSKWFDGDKEGRAVKGNISVLLKNTTENKSRYTAHNHKENVIKDYELLK